MKRLARIATSLVRLRLSPNSAKPRQSTSRIQQIAAKHYGADAHWYVGNIPFLEIDDTEIQDVYYYRWQAHRLWFLPEVYNGWSPAWDKINEESWWAVTFRKKRQVGSIELYFFEQGAVHAPASFHLKYKLEER